jgi:hypothetical protein
MAAPAEVTESLQLALAAQRQELAAYNAAWLRKDLDAFQAHRQGYDEACEVVQDAQKAVEGNILNTPDALHGLGLLSDANSRFAAATKALAADAAALSDFATAAGLVVQILSAIALI